jgi:hypothetical protein
MLSAHYTVMVHLQLSLLWTWWQRADAFNVEKKLLQGAPVQRLSFVCDTVT